ncbi:peptidylprolyl isomerase [Sphingobium sp. H39-3-25]|uniref:peptidylprolyl isomerase n=1 Tax=Sphingobium arseniciresistens TaxID=3030834 RepID=UPI0023B9A58C|nr:peptidylprolyl isomerase [Sphingobium arseniciresistens]
MAFPKGLKSLALAAILAAGASATPALAQGGKVDEARQAQLQQAAEDAAKVLNQAEKTKIPDAVVPQDPQNIWDLDLSTGGRVRIQLRPDVAPNHVARIKELTRQGFYNGLKFHRVIDGFMAQGGDPKGDGTGGSTLPDLKAEFNMLPHLRGTVSMARAASEDSANSQFFIIFLPRMQLDKKYTVFGRVIEGMQYVDAITRGEPPANPSIIVQASIEADGKAPPAMLAPPPPVPQTLPSTPLPATPATLPPRKR